MVPGCARHGARCGGDYWCLDVLSNGTCLSGWEFKGYTKKRMDAIAWIQVWLLLISDFWFFSSGHLAPFSLKKEHHCLQGFVFVLAAKSWGCQVVGKTASDAEREEFLSQADFCRWLFQEQVLVGHDIDRWRAMIFHCTESPNISGT